jgi:hypothetical protein
VRGELPPALWCMQCGEPLAAPNLYPALCSRDCARTALVALCGQITRDELPGVAYVPVDEDLAVRGEVPGV